MSVPDEEHDALLALFEQVAAAGQPLHDENVRLTAEVESIPRESIQYLFDAFIEGGYAEDAMDEHHLDALHAWLDPSHASGRFSLHAQDQVTPEERRSARLDGSRRADVAALRPADLWQADVKCDSLIDDEDRCHHPLRDHDLLNGCLAFGCPCEEFTVPRPQPTVGRPTEEADRAR